MLQTAIVQEFWPRFARGAMILHLVDAEKKRLVLAERSLEALGISALSYDKLPEVVLYQRTLDRVYLIELATSHGPVSPDRQAELDEPEKL